MNEHDVERSLRDWMEADASVTEPARLRERVLTVPESVGPTARWPRLSLTEWLRPRPLASAAVLAVLLLAALTVVTVIEVRTDDPATWRVAQDGTADFGAIAAAVAMAEDGDTVLVGPGTYVESVLIDKDITLRGDGDRDTVVIRSPDDDVDVLRHWPVRERPFAVRIDDADVTVEGLTLEGSGSALLVLRGAAHIDDVAVTDVYADSVTNEFAWGLGGVEITDGARVELRDSLVERSDIILRDASEVTIEDSSIVASMVMLECCAVSDATDPGSPTTATIRGNVFTDPWIGVWLDTSTVARIEDNEFSGATNTAVLFRRGDAGEAIRGNTIRDSKTGVMFFGLDSSDDATVELSDNRLIDNDVGLNVSGLGLSIRGNEVHGNEIGILVSHLEGGTNPTLEENTITGNGRGVSVTGASSPVLRRNVICDNEIDLRIVEAANPTLEDNEVCSAIE